MKEDILSTLWEDYFVLTKVRTKRSKMLSNHHVHTFFPFNKAILRAQERFKDIDLKLDKSLKLYTYAFILLNPRWIICLSIF